MVKEFCLRLVIFLSIWAAMCSPGRGSSVQGVYFDDSDPDLMVLGNDDYYEIGFRKANGAIAYITDKTTGQHITLGSRHECLWGALFEDGTPDYVGGCSYNATGPNYFSYTWSAANHTLTLDYTPDPGATQQVTAQVLVTATEQSWFDLHLNLENNWGYLLDYVLFPSDLVFVEADIEEVLLPILPGIVLEPSFFQQNRTYTATYPGYPGLFADYVHLASTAGHMAIYSLYEQGSLHPVVVGFVHDDEYVVDSTFYQHNFGAGVSDGNSWDSPGVRVHISLTALATIDAYCADNGLHRFSSLVDKLGVRYDQVMQSPLLKADAVQLDIPFSQYADLLAQVPSPGILHPVAFQPGGFDENYPDFLPPEVTWGTTAEFAAMFHHTQDLGFLVMPYTNPTWWDDESPTMQNLPPPLTITDIAVIDRDGNPVYEYYDSHGGYVVSPYVPFVQQRLAQLVEEITIDVPSDLLFEDQIGARSQIFDYNPASPSPTAYTQGWLDHTRTYSDVLLMTELGFDRLVENETGFHGSVLLPEQRDYTSDWWGTDTWHPYPLAPLMARDKVLFYQHDLAPETMTTSKYTFTWNLAFGYMLSYDLGYGGGLGDPWLDLVSVFQKHVLSRYASEAMTDFVSLGDNVTRTAFETFAVIANWDEVNPYDAGLHTLPPQGVLITSADGSLTGGVFAAYNDIPLSAGDHYLIEEREANAIIVRQPLGAATSLTLDLFSGWTAGDPIAGWAYTAQDQVIASVPVTVTAKDLTFTYQQEVAGQSVAYYRIFKPYWVVVPVVLRNF